MKLCEGPVLVLRCGREYNDEQGGTGQFYAWEKHARQGALAALRNGKWGRKESKQEETLKSEVERLRAVIAELSMENLELKKGRLV